MSNLRIRLSLVAAFGLLSLGLVGVAVAQPAGPPRVSPMSTVSQVVGLAKVEITYSRPFVNERQVFGELEPWGKVWRTGANEATTFTIDRDAKIEGKALPAGTYALFTIPQEKGKWTVIFNKEAQQWGAFQYKEAEDALRVEATPQSTHHHEMFTIGFSEVSSDSATVNLAWRETRVPFTIAFDTAAIARDKAQEDFETAKSGASPQAAQAVWQWANYFLQNEEHEKAALEMATWVADQREIYWTIALKARLQAANGMSEEALTSAKQAMELGRQAQEQNANQFMATDMEKLEGEVGEWQAE